MTDVTAGGIPPPRPRDGSSRWQVSALTIFLGVLAVIFVAYFLLALDLEWRTEAGRIGPGFFPRIVGALGFLLCLLCIVRSLRAADERSEAEAGGRGRHPRVLLIVVAAMVGFFLLFQLLGAILAAALFSFAVLWVIDREHLVRNVVISVLVPVGMYVLFDTLLNASLPAGVLPSF